MRTNKLTQHQLSIVAAFASGLSGNDISKILYLSIFTIRNQVKWAKKKTGAKSMNQLVAWCVAENKIQINQDGTASSIKNYVAA